MDTDKIRGRLGSKWFILKWRLSDIWHQRTEAEKKYVNQKVVEGLRDYIAKENRGKSI